MKKLGIVLLGLSAALPLHAQDPGAETPPDASATPTEASTAPVTSAEEVPSGDAPAEAAPAETPPTDASAEPPPEFTAETPPAEATAESPPADAPPAEADPYAAPVDATTAEAPPAEEPTDVTVVETPAEEAPAEPAEEEKPLIFYVGAEYGMATVSISNLQGFFPENTLSKMYQVRAGMRIHQAIGLEVHYGRGDEEEDGRPQQTILEDYYGVYIVPTGTLLDVVEFAFPLGFAWTHIKSPFATQNLNGVSYGMNIEFPFKLVFEGMPDIRICGGGMMYQQNNAARTYGWHAGLRFDFGI